MNTEYLVVCTGEVLEGFDTDTVLKNLVTRFSIREETARHIMDHAGMVLKTLPVESAAKRYQEALSLSGLKTFVKKASPGGETIPPEGNETFRAAAPEFENAPVQEVPSVSGHNMHPKETGRENSWENRVSERLPMEFQGTGFEYFRIWLVNLLLSIVTLGIYSAWAKVRRKKYVYGSTRLGGSAFEYLADPLKILKGRVVVVVFFIGYSLLGGFFPRISWVSGLAFAVVFPWLIVRSLSFNARNTAFRNIRFGFEAGYWDGVKVFALWPAAAAVTLGCLGPYAYYRQKKFLVEHSSYGTTRFEFTARAGNYYRLFFSIVLPALGGIVLIGMAAVLFLPLAGLAGFILYLIVFALFSVKTTNLFYNSCRLATHRFEADLNTWAYALLVLTNTIATALSLGIFHPWAMVRTLQYRVGHLILVPGDDLGGFVANQQEQVSAFGEEMADFMDFDFGL